jgi:hypothetical protein
MITKNKKVHYCEHCKKHGMRGPAIKTHEEHCTLNPKRTCRLCGRKEGIEEVLDGYKDFEDGKQVDVAELMDSLNDCPACTLAVIRCAKLSNVEFDYEKEMKEWWTEHNRDNYGENY